MYDSVLVPTDGSDHARGAAEHGLRLARAFGATVHAVSAVDRRAAAEATGGQDGAVLDRLTAEARAAVGAVEAMAGDLAVETAVLEGEPSEAVLEYAAANGIDLLAMGTHGRTGIDRYIAGSVTERVLRRTTVPVLTVRQSERHVDTYDELLVPTDASDPAAAAVDHGLAVAERFDARVHALTVIDTGATGVSPEFVTPGELMEQLQAEGRAATEAVAERARERGLAAVTAVHEGLAAEQLLAYADEEGIDLVAMGTAGRTGLGRYLLGSTTERVIRHAGMPVLAVNARDRGRE
jgi:nucleotide-binding universal stress UspA family protein